MILSMISVDGQSNETIVLDGEWFEKLRGAQSKTRLAASSFTGVETKVIERRKKLFGGDKEQLFQATFSFDNGPFVGFVTGIDNEPKVREIISGLEAARDGG